MTLIRGFREGSATADTIDCIRRRAADVPSLQTSPLMRLRVSPNATSRIHENELLRLATAQLCPPPSLGGATRQLSCIEAAKTVERSGGRESRVLNQ